MASQSIFRSFTLPNGEEIRTMRPDVRERALQAVKDRASISRKGKSKDSEAEPNERIKRRLDHGV